MPEPHESNGHFVATVPTNSGTDSNSTRLQDASAHHQNPATSPGDSESDVPWPFGSEPSLDEETGARRTLGNRIADALHFSKRHSRGYRKGRVDQIIRSLNEYPAGYCKVAAVEDLDPDFSIYRKFGFLHHYALLHLQDELAEIQDDLERLDRWEFSDGDAKNLISRRKDYAIGDSRRKKLMIKLHSKLAQYDESLLRMQQVQAIKRPTKRAQRNLHNLISNTQSLVADEADWIRQGPDLAALGTGSEHGWLNTVLEDVLNGISRNLTLLVGFLSSETLDTQFLLPQNDCKTSDLTTEQSVFRSSEQRIKTGDEDLNLLSAKRFDVLLRIVLTVIAAILLLVPVAVLFRLQPTTQAEFHKQSNWQILTVFLFTLAFAASCSIFTSAKRQEVFAATAAYSAVLVVFLGNASNVMMTQNTGK